MLTVPMGFTVTVIVSKSSIGGVPSSVTRTVIGQLPGPWASVGVQPNTPVDGSMLAPLGAPTSRLNVKVLAGTSGSLAVAANVSSVCSSTAGGFGITSKVGGWFTCCARRP